MKGLQDMLEKLLELFEIDFHNGKAPIPCTQTHATKHWLFYFTTITDSQDKPDKHYPRFFTTKGVPTRPVTESFLPSSGSTIAMHLSCSKLIPLCFNHGPLNWTVNLTSFTERVECWRLHLCKFHFTVHPWAAVYYQAGETSL